MTSWAAARQASLSSTNSRSLFELMSIESVMPSNHLILCHLLLLLPLIFPSIRVFSNESVLRIKWPKYWSFSFNISPSNEHPGLISCLSNPYLFHKFLKLLIIVNSFGTNLFRSMGMETAEREYIDKSLMLFSLTKILINFSYPKYKNRGRCRVRQLCNEAISSS